MSILIHDMDIPASCINCKFRYMDRMGMYAIDYCFNNQIVMKYMIDQTRPDWCPLHPIGEKPHQENCISHRQLLSKMTNEELAEWLRCFYGDACPPGNCPGFDNCYDCWLTWLNSEEWNDCT